jgi:glucokinase
MLAFKEITYQELAAKDDYVLGADIGGTNSNFGIFSEPNNKLTLFISLHIKSQDITDFEKTVSDIIVYIQKKYHISIKRLCIGAAGVIYNDGHFVKLTNRAFSLDISVLKKKLNLKTVLLINDFEAIVFGIDKISQGDIIIINKGIIHPKAHQACIGAGTGLGKSIIAWDYHLNRYISLASEGGHADCSVQYPQEFQLLSYIKEQNGHYHVSWENLLSGIGIQTIYRFLGILHKYPKTKYTQEIDKTGFPPDKISLFAQHDQRCYETFMLYLRFYARCSKNFVLDTLALNGIYITGGIAAHNVNMFFNPLFMQEFINCGKHQLLLKKVPIYVIADYNISMYGAAEYLILKEKGKI